MGAPAPVGDDRGVSEPRRLTPFADLDGVLVELVRGVKDVLGNGCVGVYLTGSFAVGDADAFSDVDFLVVVRDEIDELQRMGLQTLHEQLYGLPVEWAQHLEGSYAPAARLRRLETEPSPFLFLDNGATRLEPDTHCNTAVVRWVLREHAHVLEGPDPRTLVDPLPPNGLRRETVGTVAEYVEWAPAPTKAGGAMSRWKQPYLVLTLCRLLHTLTFDRVTSKRLAGEWALAELDRRWQALIRRAIDDRPDPWARVHQAALRADVAETLAFAEYTLAEAGRRAEQLGL